MTSPSPLLSPLRVIAGRLLCLLGWHAWQTTATNPLIWKCGDCRRVTSNG